MNIKHLAKVLLLMLTISITAGCATAAKPQKPDNNMPPPAPKNRNIKYANINT